VKIVSPSETSRRRFDSSTSAALLKVSEMRACVWGSVGSGVGVEAKRDVTGLRSFVRKDWW